MELAPAMCLVLGSEAFLEVVSSNPCDHPARGLLLFHFTDEVAGVSG